jgi:uncharacterized protein YjbI with pentapeptide repeats
MADLFARTPVRDLSPDEVEQMLALHRLYLETEYHECNRANFSSVDLTGRDFSGLNLRGIKMDRAVLRGADFTGAHLQSANLIGAILQEAHFDRADLSRARLSGANLVSASLENTRLAKAEMEFALMANSVLRGACLQEADMSGAQLDGTVLIGADLRKANLRGAGLRHAKLGAGDLRDNLRLLLSPCRSFRYCSASHAKWCRAKAEATVERGAPSIADPSSELVP